MAYLALLLCSAAVLSMAVAGRDDCKEERAAGLKPQSRASRASCVDLIADNWCASRQYRCKSNCDLFKQNCQATCGLCGAYGCADAADWCGPQWAARCGESHVSKYCQKTCGQC